MQTRNPSESLGARVRVLRLETESHRAPHFPPAIPLISEQCPREEIGYARSWRTLGSGIRSLAVRRRAVTALAVLAAGFRPPPLKSGE